jgi:hypothetical protein
MVTTAPKNSRDKRLHIVFFTDASKTKSTSISLRNLLIAGCASFIFFSGAGTSLYLYKKNRDTLTSKDEYIRELKSSITALAISEDKNQTIISGENDAQRELTQRISREIQFPSDSGSKTVSQSGEKTLASLQSSLSSLSTVSANLARSDKAMPKNTAISQGKQPADEKSPVAETAGKAVGPAQTAPKPATPATEAAQSVKSAAKQPPLAGVQVEQSHVTEANGRTTLHFQLVNTLKNRSHSWTGRVCGIAELSASSAESAAGQVNLSARTQVAGFVAVPSGSRVDSATTPNNSCADGQLVRFSRLRPTELVIPAKHETIKRVTIFFVESGSNRMHSQPIEL